MALLISWLVLTVSFVVTSKLVDGFQLKGGLGNQLLVAAIFGVLNALIGYFLYLVVGIGTLGLAFIFSFIGRLVATALVLKLVDAMTDKLKVKSFGTAFVAALVMSVVGAVTEYALGLLGIG
jgi:putative membrane protein